VIAGQLAKQANYPKPEFAFVSALLHDFGVILMDEFFPLFLKKTLHLTSQKGESFHSVSKQKWGMTHNDVVKKLFTEWNMPDEVLEVITHFESYKTYTNAIDKDMVTLVQIVGVSNQLAKSLSLGRECDEFISIIPNDILTNIRVIGQFNDSFLQKIAGELSMFSTHLGLNIPPVSFSKSVPDSEINHRICFTEQDHQIFNPFEHNLYSQKNVLTFVDSIDEIPELDVSPDIVIIHATPDQDISEFEELFSLVKKEDKEKEEKEEKEESTEEPNAEKTPNDEVLPTSDSIDTTIPLPILIIGGKPKTDTDNFPIHVVQVPDEIDLRIISFAIDSLIIGNPFSLSGEPDADEERMQPAQSNTLVTQKKTIQTEDVPLTFKTRVVENRAVVIELHGAVKGEKFKELINILITLLNKTPNLGIDFSHTTDVPLEFYLLLENFKKVLREKKGQLCSFHLEDEDIKAHINTDYISTFKTDAELIQCLNLETKK